MITYRLRSIAAGAALFVFSSQASEAVLGLISTTLSDSSPNVSDTITVSLNLSGYADVEADGWSLKVSYPPAQFNYGGNVNYGTGAGGTGSKQWLTESNQDLQDAGFSQLAFNDGTLDGVVTVALSDFSFPTTQRGSNTAAGFLVAFDLVAEAAGTGEVTVELPTTGRVFQDVTLADIVTGNPTGLGSGMGASFTVVPEPSTTILFALGLAALVSGRRRRD